MERVCQIYIKNQENYSVVSLSNTMLLSVSENMNSIVELGYVVFEDTCLAISCINQLQKRLIQKRLNIRDYNK